MSQSVPSHTPHVAHTVEMAQLAEIGARLASDGRPVVTAGDLGLLAPAEGSTRAGTGVPSSAALVGIDWDGPASYPYVHGHFTGEGLTVVTLHTAALAHLSRRLGLRHVWGVGSLPPPGRP